MLRRPPSRLLASVLLAGMLLVVTMSGAPVATGATASLTNGCAVSPRGIPSCGAYVGGALDSNSAVGPWEFSAGKLGIHRLFYTSGQVSAAVRAAQADAANRRISWISFKPPYSWADMAKGRGDAWARDLASRLKAVGSPVWVAVHHEPENDAQDLQQWTAMQARLAPIVRAAAPNVAYTVILMGYHQFYGAAKYGLDRIWPSTTIDVAGFDVYERYGVVKNRVMDTTWTDFKGDYFDRIESWANSVGVEWALAETGFSDPAAARKPSWVGQTYDLLVGADGIAFSYFNSILNSTAHWALTSPAEKAAFAAINARSPHLS